jgi:hypothetical protein
VLYVRNDALPESHRQLNQRKRDSASENPVKHQIDKRTHESVSSRGRIASHTTTGLIWKRRRILVANKPFTGSNKNMNTSKKNPAAVALSSVKSEKKAKAACVNDAKGGRPRTKG